MTSIYLPGGEDTEVNINVKGSKKSIKIDIFELDDLFTQAQRMANDMNTSWGNEFPRLFKAHTGTELTVGQASLLWMAIRDQMNDLKKSLRTESSPSNGQASPSKRKTRKKRQ